ncbi:ABC transporter ATPase [Daejeonella sp.]|uniref:ABC transporter ATPase n=1 Tax=Daejeonella sp. TaxID=2805397 RepID=UPI0027307136|nr:ABC transporter ATPase [Daejeonella sp.]MDP2412348.1 ABC transporter ATPase [Daejeonella sp.]
MNISENSRVWIYQSDRPFTNEEEQAIQKILNDFTTEWQAHGHALAALAEIYHHQFIALSVDEQIAGATGCSIDKSVHLMKELESKFNINLFDRFRMAYKSGEDIINCSREEFEERIKKGIVDGKTLVFNNLISRRKELETSWNIPLADSWHAKVFSF